ncbi:hypothetical protein C8R48DRAFT_710736 [Suillus tomentosus]|nr:hypothetical protein C8R48DRAFT_710736 [Suillus tomentosus]
MMYRGGFACLSHQVLSLLVHSRSTDSFRSALIMLYMLFVHVPVTYKLYSQLHTFASITRLTTPLNMTNPILFRTSTSILSMF